jgi:hypothetical protein
MECFKWDGRLDYDGYLTLLGDVFIKLGFWVHKAYMNDLTCLELCSQAVSLLNDIQERLFFAFYDERALRLVVPVLKRFIDGDYPYEDYDYDLTNLMRFVDELRQIYLPLQILSKQINREKEEEDRRKALNVPSDVPSDELPF